MHLLSKIHFVLLAIGLGLSACGERRLTCADLKSKQAVREAYRAGAKYLDGDGDGIACGVRVEKKKRLSRPAQPRALPNAAGGAAQMAFGNPSHASTSSENYLIVRPQYALSYNARRGTPNWVSWQLDRSSFGSTERQNDFRPDQDLPPGMPQVAPDDYTGSGFDRGHMAPSADRTRSRTDNSATFLMTNIVPQEGDLNRGPWEALESYARDLAEAGKTLYIVAGVAGEKGTIARGKITVPSRTWKAILVLDRPNLAPQDVPETARVIAVDMPNRRGILRKDWRQYRTTVDKIEAATGYDLFDQLPPRVQTALEARLDGQ